MQKFVSLNAYYISKIWNSAVKVPRITISNMISIKLLGFFYILGKSFGNNQNQIVGSSLKTVLYKWTKLPKSFKEKETNGIESLQTKNEFSKKVII